VIDLDAVTQAVTDHLNDEDVLAGRGVKPDGGGWQGSPGQSEFVPYVIVWRIGSKDRTHRDVDGNFDRSRPLFHIRYVGATATQADALQRDGDEALLKTPLPIAGVTVTNVLYDTSITTTVDRDVTPHVFYTGSYIRLWLDEESP
jgi:hypothetical protein